MMSRRFWDSRARAFRSCGRESWRMIDRISAAYCLFWETGRSFFSILDRSQWNIDSGRRLA